MVAVLALAAYAVATGMQRVAQQRDAVSHLVTLTQQDRTYANESHLEDPGSAAYYGFHLTFEPLSNLAFAALGRRDDLPWQHRIRALALEGQIYESDTGHPELAIAGRLDYAFLVAVLLPLFIILSLFDLEASERRHARRELLIVTSPTGRRLFGLRAAVRGAFLFAAVTAPLLVGAWLSRTDLGSLATAIAVTAFSVAVWVLLARLVTRTGADAATSAMLLVGIWLLTVIVIPQAGKLVIERSVAVPQGAEILLTQREAVNDAWDLPKAATMEPFVAQHPEWRDHVSMSKPFEWKWYYAFQQVGDQIAEPLALDLQSGREARDRRMGWLALLSPSLMVERVLTRSAGTDMRQHLRYLSCVRDFHGRLRRFFYPYLFETQAFGSDSLEQLPLYAPCGSG